MEDKILFKFKCTRTCNERFELGKIYNMYICNIKRNDNSGLYSFIIRPDHDTDITSRQMSYTSEINPKQIYAVWYDGCRWTDYSFEYVDANGYVVDLL